jgi:hypothetical protein
MTPAKLAEGYAEGAEKFSSIHRALSFSFVPLAALLLALCG